MKWKRLTFGSADEYLGGQTVADFVVGSQFDAVQRRRFQSFQIEFHRRRVVEVGRDFTAVAHQTLPRVVAHLQTGQKTAQVR